MPGNRAESLAEETQDQRFAKPDPRSLNVYCNRDERYKGYKASEEKEFEVVFGGRNAIKNQHFECSIS